ncbi:protein-glutamate methylesterase/protein-glutamine glutaminase [Candidatus Desulforudis audaxviator]|uniref:Protein-glutamate methylesterase/protein-glutamine glutaminase n=1 Tax=Desulforudis audaxviator (strain MP104C) TaxID=477974 RepID=B1I5H9_DESAP|nr:chemotaxis response regulator protein-glutamate methylesterase [Candidatus Desulforudis audaxviator]ACA60287.1 response regulator receiver modulated CheB methylesterase [Candidatus Desulforudis audaxviator MP104C]AZK60334.1 Chemotaxis response regulator protein-glutamate methylesterase CheB [Candidatus Desulforudis audaxviator]
MPPVRVFLVDDSAVVRTIIGRRLREIGFEVVGTAMNGKDALRKIPVLRPEVVVMDVEMPELDGLNTLRELMISYPVPVIMLSAHTRAGSKATIEALALGAVDFVPKPIGTADITAIIAELAVKISAAAGASVRGALTQAVAPEPPRAPLAPVAARAPKRKTDLVVIGCSTGGPNALRVLLPGFPANLPAAVVVVQHMPAGFTALLAEHLDAVCAMEVRHARDNDPVVPGRVLIAPAGKAFRFRPGPDGVRVSVSEDNTPPAPGTFRPSVDEVMTQAAAIYGSRVTGVLLTGMGRDGAGGMLAIKQKNGYTIAQDEASCVVYGMPRAAVENGAACRVLPLSEISAEVVQQL